MLGQLRSVIRSVRVCCWNHAGHDVVIVFNLLCLFVVVFCFVLFCFVLFCFVLFCFVLFCFVLFCFVLFCFVLFCFVLFVYLGMRDELAYFGNVLP